MNRNRFLKNLIAVPAVAAGFASARAGNPENTGVRRLKADKFLTAWTPSMEPAYRVSPGEIVTIEMSHGMPGLVTRDGVFSEPGPGAITNPLTGPVYIEGIGPGDGLAIDILDIQTGDWGYCSGNIFEIRAGFVIFSNSLKLAVQPMIGCLGIAPESGSTDTRAPGDTGGNMDCSEVRAGSTILLKSRVPGALAGMGDCHALMGDGEITGQGVETDAAATVRFRKTEGPLSERPVIIRTDSYSTLGAHKDLEEAAWQATDDMVRIVSRLTGIPEKKARILVGLVGRLKVNQIVDPTKGIRMEMPSWVFGIKQT